MKPTRTIKPSVALFNDAPSPRAAQFRMRRLQVFNWGTFTGLTDIPIAERGFLFVGRSGSGKSTLLDAMSALLVPPSLVDFNAAAREAERTGRDRSVVSYIRGAWADQHDAHSGEIATQYLRKGATWSGLVLEYQNQLGETVSLIRLFWIAGNSTAAADVRRHFMVATRPFDMVTELQGFDLDLRKLKQQLGDSVQHFDGFAGYAERFRHSLGINNEMALKLLHKTQSAKNLGDLNTFLRSFMLDEPQTFAAADRLVEDFTELDEAHKAVQMARQQVETLGPARGHYQGLMAIRGGVGSLQELQQGIDSYREFCRRELLQQRLNELQRSDNELSQIEIERHRYVEEHQQHLISLEQQRREQGGERIDELEREYQRVEVERNQRISKRQHAENLCQQWGKPLPTRYAEFSELIQHAQTVVADISQQQTQWDEHIAVEMSEKRQFEQRFTEIRKEIENLQRTPSSIPAPMQTLRAKLAAGTGISETRLPFVGELLQVKAQEIEWRGAIERVLHNFSLSILVEDKDYAAVTEWVNHTHLDGRLVFYRVRDTHTWSSPQPDQAALVTKLEIRHPIFESWLYHELCQRFDYICVENSRVLAHVERGITRQGQVKHSGERYEKDDRHSITDRKRWLLGFNNQEKRLVFEMDAQAIANQMAASDQTIAGIRQQRQLAQQHHLACQSLLHLQWDEIDVEPKLQRLEHISQQLQELREGNQNLRVLGEKIAQCRQELQQFQREYEDVRIERAQLQREHQQLDNKYQQCKLRLEQESPSEIQIQGLSGYLLELSPLTLDSVEFVFRQLERTLGEQLDSQKEEDQRLSQRVLDCFRRYCQQWPEDSGNFTISLTSAEDFLARLQRLESDGLPQHEARFFELLQTHSKNNLNLLQRYIQEAKRSIVQRMEEVNSSLEQVPFNQGTLLTIAINDRRLPEVQLFQQQLRDVLTHQQTDNRALAESQFTVLRDLVEKLGSPDPELRRWRENVLDVRLHVEFIGIEIDAQTREQIEIYRSGAGKSGGQRQKLATTCLAAALRYQLGGEDGELPRYAAVVLDEAFDKADSEFTALAMNIFENFGFQMIVATPLKSVMTLEPFIGGACFVEMSGRHDSGILLIEYDNEENRLKLPK